MQFDILTLFPEIFDSFLNESLLKKALDKKLLEINLVNFREQGLGKHKKIDDQPYGGGAGMVLKIEPIAETLKIREQLIREKTINKPIRKILLSPQGKPFNQQKAIELANTDEVIMLICGRYEGFDERVRSLVDEEISCGDYILMGGEVVAMMLIEAVSRLKKGVIGNNKSTVAESFSDEKLLEYPQYTRPKNYEGQRVPDILCSGNHEKIKQWRNEKAKLRTSIKRPDLV